MSNVQPIVPMIATYAEARAALGKLVQVRGTVHREQLGDTLSDQPRRLSGAGVPARVMTIWRSCWLRARNEPALASR
jgi:hypothetical protein